MTLHMTFHTTTGPYPPPRMIFASALSPICASCPYHVPTLDIKPAHLSPFPDHHSHAMMVLLKAYATSLAFPPVSNAIPPCRSGKTACTANHDEHHYLHRLDRTPTITARRPRLGASPTPSPVSAAHAASVLYHPCCPAAHRDRCLASWPLRTTINAGVPPPAGVALAAPAPHSRAVVICVLWLCGYPHYRSRTPQPSPEYNRQLLLRPASSPRRARRFHCLPPLFFHRRCHLGRLFGHSECHCNTSPTYRRVLLTASSKHHTVLQTYPAPPAAIRDPSFSGSLRSTSIFIPSAPSTRSPGPFHINYSPFLACMLPVTTLNAAPPHLKPTCAARRGQI
ncbi:hypothetical protein B0H13DRAFT_2578116 [Mycena leptocephala]|nr:hypothetical protein B0H13DRAFT_2578116 [Mycena leptocephala]